ncbi:MAG: protein-glutamate O-methyltransferase [Hyphomonadaceae bacterium]|nr:protein-glutamate O-methyltransferase [Hyphomonadaceae bacterium]
MSALPAPQRRSESIIEGEYAFTRRNFEQIATFLKEQSGIALNDAKAQLVYSRLAKRLRKLGIPDFDAYCEFINTPEGVGERNEMLAALTTNVTRFYREPHHFEHLERNLLPSLVEHARRGGRVRLWSAACSSGEEPYSIALTLLKVFPDAARHDVRILATDIDPNIVAKARLGVYRDDAVSPIPAALRDRWLTRDRDNEQWRVNDEVRALIAFKELNLIGSWPMQGKFNVIFCRNVVIYFEEKTQAFLWNRFKTMLAPEGRLYIGHSERIDVDGYVSDGLTIYRQNA